MNLEPRVSCALHNSLPRAKDKKRQKQLGLDVQAVFYNPSECNKLHPPSHLSIRSVLLHFVQRSPPETRTLYKGGKKGLFNSGVLEKRELFGERRKEWSVYYKFYKIYSNTEFLSTRRALATLSTVWRRTLFAFFLFYTNTKCIKSI